jgi:hypothetical protein
MRCPSLSPLRYDFAQNAMMISVFSFGLSWIAYAFVFYGITMFLPQFHSTYHETIFKVGFTLGFFDAGMLRLARIANFRLNWIGLFVVTALVNWALIMMTNNTSADYDITGKSAPIIAALALTAFVIPFDALKNRVLSDVRL